MEEKYASSSFLFFFSAVIFSVSTFRINTNNQIMFVISGKENYFQPIFFLARAPRRFKLLQFVWDEEA